MSATAIIIVLVIIVVAVVAVVAVVHAMRKNAPGQPPVVGIISWITSKMLGFAKGVLHLLGL